MLGSKRQKEVLPMSFDAPVISIEKLSKTYRTFNSPKDRLIQNIVGEKKIYYKEFHALRDISFDVYRGEKLGIIGRNGSGKSTLLQIMAGTLKPTHGNVQVKGRIAALLELGSGFNPEFSGRENVYLNGSIFGLSNKEIDELFDKIVDFSEIGDFIERPVKTYSSGMFVRLAFSVAIHVRPDILIVDEALTVGDVFFQRKCFSSIEELNREGTTLIYVTHELATLKQVVDRAILLESGKMIFDGTPVEAVNKFYMSVYGSSDLKADSSKESDIEKNHLTHEERLVMNDRERYGTRDASIENVIISGSKGVVWSGNPFKCNVRIQVMNYISQPVFGIRIKTATGIDVYASNTRDEGIFLEDLLAGHSYTIEIKIENFNLIAGEYFLSLALGFQDKDNYVPVDHRIDFINLKVIQKEKSTGISNLKPIIRLEKD
jgi:teichoic acid transport system ATP-binding protein